MTDGDLTVKDKKLMAKLRNTKDVRRKSEIWSNADLSREQGEQLVRNMVLSLPAGYYKLHDREYGTNLVDKIYDMYGWMPSMLVSESTMLGLQALHPEKVYASFTHGLDAIEIKQPKSPQILKVHDDGDLTVKKGDTDYVVTTEGKTFKEVKPEPELKEAVHESHELGEKAEKHTDHKGHAVVGPISTAENRAIHAWYTEGPLPKVEEEEAEPVKTPGGEWHKKDGKWKFHKTNGHSPKLAHLPSGALHPAKLHNAPATKGAPRPHMAMTRKGKMVVIHGVGTANVRHLPKGRILRKKR